MRSDKIAISGEIVKPDMRGEEEVKTAEARSVEGRTRQSIADNVYLHNDAMRSAVI